MSKPRIKKFGIFWKCTGMGQYAIGQTPKAAWDDWKNRVWEANISAMVPTRAKPWEYGPVRAG